MLPSDLIMMLYSIHSFIISDEHCMLSPLSANLQYLTPYFLSYVVTLLLFPWDNKSNQKIFPKILIIIAYQDPLGTIYSTFSPVPMDEISVLLVKAISSICAIDLTSFCLLKNITLAIVPSLLSHHQILAASTESISLMYKWEVNSSNLNKNFLDITFSFSFYINFSFLIYQNSWTVLMFSNFSPPTLLNPLQSAFCLCQSSINTLMKVTNDSHIMKSSGGFSVLSWVMSKIWHCQLLSPLNIFPFGI